MPTCPHCHQEIFQDSRYCTHCGQDVAAAPAPAPEAEAPPPPVRELRPGEYLKAGWALFKRYPQGFVGFALLSLLVTFVMQRVPVLGPLASMVIHYPLTAGYLAVGVLLLKGQTPQFADFFTGFRSHYLLPLALMGLVSSLLVVLGFILLVAPGVYLAVSYMFAPFFILDRKMDFWPAMEASRKAITPRWFGYFAFSLMLFVVLLGGILLLGVGLLVALPVCTCTLVAAYDDLFGLSSTF